ESKPVNPSMAAFERQRGYGTAPDGGPGANGAALWWSGGAHSQASSFQCTPSSSWREKNEQRGATRAAQLPSECVFRSAAAERAEHPRPTRRACVPMSAQSTTHKANMLAAASNVRFWG